MDGLVVIIAYDPPLTRGLLCEHLRGDRSFTAVIEASAGTETLALAARHRPHVILLGTHLPDMTGFNAARLLGAAHPAGRLVFLNTAYDPGEMQQAVALGASGYLTSMERPESVVTAVRIVAQGGSYFPEFVDPRLPAAPVREVGKTVLSRGLTQREVDILRYIATGMAKRQIAHVLRISIKTVDRHAANLMNKLNIHDRVGLARFAIREGLFDP